MNLPYFKHDLPPFKPLGFIDSTPIANELEKLTLDDWKKYDFRRGHISSYTLPIVWTSPSANPLEPMKRITVTEYLHLLDVVKPLIDKALEFYPGGRIVRVMFTYMTAGSEVGCHIDSGLGNRSGRRCHLPIKTNKDVLFFIDGKEYNFPLHEAIEINNTLIHGVRNMGTEPRIHLIVDILPSHFTASIEDVPWEGRL